MAERRASRLLLALLACIALHAHALQPGEVLPALEVEELGEMQLAGDAIRYEPWRSGSLGRTVQVIQYMAARPSSKKLNEAFTNTLRDSGLPFERYHVTTIVNLDDAVFGTRKIVLAELEKNKRRYFRSSIVADTRGLGLAAWRLSPASSAIIVLGPDARVQFFRDGAMSPQEIEEAMALVRRGASEPLAELE